MDETCYSGGSIFGAIFGTIVAIAFLAAVAWWIYMKFYCKNLKGEWTNFIFSLSRRTAALTYMQKGLENIFFNFKLEHAEESESWNQFAHSKQHNLLASNERNLLHFSVDRALAMIRSFSLPKPMWMCGADFSIGSERESDEDRDWAWKTSLLKLHYSIDRDSSRSLVM